MPGTESFVRWFVALIGSIVNSSSITSFKVCVCAFVSVCVCVFYSDKVSEANEFILVFFERIFNLQHLCDEKGVMENY